MARLVLALCVAALALPALAAEPGELAAKEARHVAAAFPGRTARDARTFYGDAFHTVRATHGGFLELLVDLRDKVAAGQKVAIQRNSFGEVVKEYVSGVAGEVSTIQRDAMIEPGTRVVQILHDSPDSKCDGDGCGEESADYVE